MSNHPAREISYAHCAQTRGGRVLIRALENSTGRLGLIKRAVGYEADLARGRDFWEVMAERYGLTLDVIGGGLENIPRSGPLILIANHPYGILDGLMMGLILSRARGDFRIMANSVFQKSEALERAILPISFDPGKAAQRMNLQTRAHALEFLRAHGAIGIFPGGTVSTAARPMGLPLDPNWRAFTARMVSKSNAAVVPIYFDGHNSRLFQIASHLHASLRLGLLIKEFRKKIDTPVRVAIGAPLDQDALSARARDPREMMDFLRRSTYELSPKPLDAARLGYDFEDKHRERRY